jgi:hypothetical protein
MGKRKLPYQVLAPMIFHCPECFHRAGKRQKNTPGSYLHGGISESKKKEN